MEITTHDVVWWCIRVSGRSLLDQSKCFVNEQDTTDVTSQMHFLSRCQNQSTWSFGKPESWIRSDVHPGICMQLL